MMVWALLALFLCYIDRVLISLAAIEMKDELSWSDTDKGLVLSSFFIGYLIMQFLGGILSNRFGGRNVFLVAVIIWSLFTALTPPAALISFEALIVARFMVGFGEGAAFPAVYSLINGWMEKTEVSRSIGFMTASTSAGTIFALLVAGKMMAIYGWPSAFYVFGALGIVWAACWVWLIPAQTPHAERQIENGTVSNKLPTPWKLLLTHPSVLCLYVIAMSGAMISYTLVTWMPSYFADTFGMSMAEAGAYSLLPFIAITFSTIAAGIAGDRLIKNGVPTIRVRKWLTYAGFVISALALTAITVVESRFGAVACMTISFAALGIAVPGYSVMPAELLPDHGEILYGFLAATGTLASTVIIALTGIILDATGSYDTMFIIMVAGSLVGLLFFAIFGRNEPIYGASSGVSRANV
ncbi:MAG: MFS transporter [Parasphingorhabdus sp.]